MESEELQKTGKAYTSIGEVAEMMGENISLIRFWTDKFSRFVKPVRNKKGNRLYRQEDISNLKRIHYFVKDLGMTLEGAEKKMSESRVPSDKRKEEIAASLKSIKDVLLEIDGELKTADREGRTEASEDIVDGIIRGDKNEKD